MKVNSGKLHLFLSLSKLEVHLGVKIEMYCKDVLKRLCQVKIVYIFIIFFYSCQSFMLFLFKCMCIVTSVYLSIIYLQVRFRNARKLRDFCFVFSVYFNVILDAH